MINVSLSKLLLPDHNGWRDSSYKQQKERCIPTSTEQAGTEERVAGEVGAT